MFIDSTLGYEAISRGKKIISIPCRMKNKKIYHPLDTQPFPQKNLVSFIQILAMKKIY